MTVDKKTKLVIKEFAKELYLQIDENGDRVYSLTDIADEIKGKFDVSLTKQSLSIWSQKEGWELLLQQARNLGIERHLLESKKELQGKQDKELSIKDELSKKIASYRQLAELSHVSSKYIMNKSLQIVSEFLREKEALINERFKAGEITKFDALDEKLDLVLVVSEHVSTLNLNLISNSSLEHILKLDSNFKEKEIDPVSELVNILRQVK
jgi:hypothetical protein